MTNLEYIRSMTDAELAAFLCDLAAGEGCYDCPANAFCGGGKNGMIEYLTERGEREE